MLTRFKSLLTAPTFADEERTHAARLLNSILWATLLITSLYAIGVGLAGEAVVLRLSLVGVGLTLEVGILWLLRRGLIRFAGFLFASATWLLLILSAYFFGGVRDPNFSALVVVILIAGLLLGRGAGVLFAGLSMAAGLALLYLELIRQLPPSLSPGSAIQQWLTTAAIFGLVALILHLTLQRILEARDQAQRNELALIDNNRELQAARAALETHVAELQQAQAALRQTSAELEQRVQERTVELARANAILHAEVAERQRAAEVARLNEERFQLVSYATNDAVWDYDLTSGMVWWNQGVQTLFGYKPAEIEPVITWWEERLHPDERVTVLNSFRKVLEQHEQFWSKEYRFRRADGAYAYVFDRAYVMHDAEQRPTRVVGAMLDLTNLKQAEAALRESEERLRLLFEHSPDAILIVDPHSTSVPWMIVDCNEAAGRMNGYAREELIGQSLEILNTTPGDDEEHARYLARLRAAGLLHYETVHRRRDNQLMSVEVSTSVVAIAGRELVLGIDRDITQRKLAEQALLDSEQRYRELFAAAQRQAVRLQGAAEIVRIITSLLDLEQILARVTDLIWEHFGYYHVNICLVDKAREWVVLRAASGEAAQLLREEQARLALNDQSLITATIRTGQPHVVQAVLAEPLYRPHPLLPAVRAEAVLPLRIGAAVLGVLDVESAELNAFTPDTISILSIIADQTAIAIETARLFSATQRQAKEIAALYHASAQLLNPGLGVNGVAEQIARAVTEEFATANCSVLMLNAEQTELNRVANVGDFLATGAKTISMTGAGLTVAAAVSAEMVYAPDVRADPRYLAKDSRTCSELVVPMLIGERVLGVLDLQSPQVDGFDERARRIVDAFAKHAGLALGNAELLTNLEQAYNTLQAEQKKLLLSEKMASLGRLTAGIAHEMNTPLATMRAALAELLSLIHEYQASIGDAEVTPADHAAIVSEMLTAGRLADNAAERAATFVRGIKAQTRDLAPHEHQHFDAVAVIQEGLTLLGHALRQGQCTVNFLPEADYIELHGSPGRLAQVITNLVTNAIDASAPHGGPIELRLTQTPTGVDLRVSDQGSGIASEHLPKIFDPMFTTKPFGEGTGLGLTIVHDIVTGDFQGTVEVDSAPGRGATFKLHFPYVQEHSHGT